MEIFLEIPNDIYIEKFAAENNLLIVNKPSYRSYFVYNELGLFFQHKFSKNRLHLDFLKGSIGWRLTRVDHERHLKKALGRSSKELTVFDGTGGFLYDSLILLSLGHKVVAVEQSKTIYCLVKDALNRAVESIDCLEKLEFICGDSYKIFKHRKEDFDAIYLDPMYPNSSKKFKNSEKMETLKKILIEEEMSTNPDELFIKFRDENYKKIILKRPLKSEKICSNINYQILGKTMRYDVYL